MGLDMYAKTTAQRLPAVDFEPPEDTQDLYYWRKHPDLHGWFERLYERKGGKNPDFNCATLRLDLADLAQLEGVVLRRELPTTTGFFFGQSSPEDMADDLEFIVKARAAIRDGLTVFYYAWW